MEEKRRGRAGARPFKKMFLVRKFYLGTKGAIGKLTRNGLGLGSSGLKFVSSQRHVGGGGIGQASVGATMKRFFAGLLILFHLPAIALAREPAAKVPHVFTFQSAAKLGSVTIAGSFNDWSAVANPLVRDADGRSWRMTLDLPPGVYRYRFVLNGDSWVIDPQGGREKDDKGRPCSTITIGPLNPYRAPLYWSTYEYNFKVDGSIPEKEWAANIDWVEQTLKPYGYDMVSIDGWGDEVYNKDGYRSSHAKEWTHDYAWWSRNLQSRGMKLGIYNNPLWIIKAAADAGIKIKGTDIPIKSLLDEKEKARFNWVQVNRPGAEQYVKGYVQYYADMGVRYLRVDFLSWYESGHDRYLGRVGPDRPKADYETALRWIKEACDANGIFLSLVMPNLNNEGEEEVRYGSMFRVDEDCDKGTWGRFSDYRRGERLPGWSQYGNAFDGLTYWSSVAGRKQVILDPDFLRINTFANDDEKKSAVSLCLMAGAPVTVADQYSTIGNNLWVYQNREMLALNRDGFVGKPLSTDPTDELSQTWKGQMSNGDWIVGFFNREKDVRPRSIDFSTLGLKGDASVRDLWMHKDLGVMGAFSAWVAPHGCVIIRVAPGGAAK